MYSIPSFLHLFSLETLQQAFHEERIRTQEGARLFDPDSLAFLRDPPSHLHALYDALQSETYAPTPPRSFQQGPSQRRIHLCNLSDRIVQRILLWTLSPICETFFLPSSYAYRPKRSAQAALQHILHLQQQGFSYAYRSDIEGFFDNVPHHRLAEMLRLFQSPPLTRLILRILASASASNPHPPRSSPADLEAALRYGGLPFRLDPSDASASQHSPHAFPRGLPLGFPLSPLLANLYLHPFDRALYYADIQLIRYADDFTILCKSHQDALDAAQFAEKQLLLLQLQPNPEKTFLCSLQQGISFLGLTLDHTGIHPAPDALLSLQQQLLDLQQQPELRSNTTQRHLAMRSFAFRWFQYYRSFANFQPANPEIALIIADVAEQSGLSEQSQQILHYHTHGDPMKDPKKNPKQSSKHSRQHASDFTQRTQPVSALPSKDPTHALPLQTQSTHHNHLSTDNTPQHQTSSPHPESSAQNNHTQQMLLQGNYAAVRDLFRSSPPSPSPDNRETKLPFPSLDNRETKPPSPPTPTTQPLLDLSLPHTDEAASFLQQPPSSKELSAAELLQALRDLHQNSSSSSSLQSEEKQYLLYHPRMNDDPLLSYASRSQPRPLSLSLEEFEQRLSARQAQQSLDPSNPQQLGISDAHPPNPSTTSPNPSAHPPKSSTPPTPSTPSTPPTPPTPSTSSTPSTSPTSSTSSPPHRLAHLLSLTTPQNHLRTETSSPPTTPPASPSPHSAALPPHNPASITQQAKVTPSSPYETPSTPPLPPTAHAQGITFSQTAPLLISEDVRAQYMALFRVRTDQISRAKTLPQQRVKYETIQRPWDEQAFAEILHGEVTYAFFLHDPKQMTCYISALDIDIHKQAIQSAQNHPERTQQHIDTLHQWTLQLSSALTLHGFPMILEESGYRGRHLWVFFREPISVEAMRTFWKVALSLVPARPECLQVEIFPDVDPLVPTDTDQPIKAPLAVHPLSQKRSAFLHPQSGKPLNPHKALMPTFPTSRQTLESWLLERLQELQPQDLGLRFPTAQRLMQACPLVQNLVQKAYDTSHLTHAERVSLLYCFGPLGEEGREFLHFIIRRTSNYQYAVTDDYIQKRRPFPISCNRLKDKHPYLNQDIRCRCNLGDLPPGIYPTPILHVLPVGKIFTPDIVRAVQNQRNQRRHPSAVPLPTPRTPSFFGPSYAPPQRPHQPEQTPPPPHLRDANAVLRKMVELRQQRRSLEDTMQMLSQSLADIFDAKEIEQLETDVGLLVRKKMPDGTWEWNLIFDRF